MTNISTINISMLGELGDQINKELLWYYSNKDIIEKDKININWGLNPISKEVIIKKVNSKDIVFDKMSNINILNGYLFMYGGLFHNLLKSTIEPDNKFYDYRDGKFFRPYYEAGIHITKFLTFKSTSHIIDIHNINEYIEFTRELSKEYILQAIKNTPNKKLAISKESFDYEYYNQLAATINLLK